MKKLVLLTLHLICFEAYSQQYSQDPPKIPLFSRASLTKTTNHLTKNTSNDFEKVNNIYHWIAHHIKYDVKAYVSEEIKDYPPKKVFKRKKGVCQHYAALFEEMCNIAEVECLPVYGYTIPVEHEPQDNILIDEHVWNAVKVEGKWHLIDVTWGSGKLVYKSQKFRQWIAKIFNKPFIYKKLKFKQSYKTAFLFAEPKQFVKSHLPAHPMWQLQPCITSMSSFEHYNFGASDSCFDYKASINKYAPFDKIDQYRMTAEQGIKFNPNNHRIIAFASVFYASDIYQTYLKDQELKLKYLHIAKEYLQKSIHHGILYKQGNYEHYRFKRKQSAEERQQVLNPIASISNSIKSRITTVSRFLSNVKGYQNDLQEDIQKRTEDQAKRNKIDIDRIKRPSNRRDEWEQFCLEKLYLLDSNQVIIDHYQDSLNTCQTQIEEVMKEITLLEESKLDFYLSIRNRLPYISDLIRDNAPRLKLIHEVQVVADEYKNWKTLSKKLYSLRNYVYKKLSYQRDKYLRKQVNLLTQNKNIWKIIKSRSYKQRNEAQEYQKFYTLIKEKYSLLLLKYKDKLELNEVRKKWSLRERTLLEKIGSRLKKIKQMERLRIEQKETRAKFKYQIEKARIQELLSFAKQKQTIVISKIMSLTEQSNP